MTKLISRRTLLKGVGVSIALPWLEAMTPSFSFAIPMPALPMPPRRMAFIYIPNGIHMRDWTPSATGATWELPHILEPLAPVKDSLLVLSGLTLDKARPNGDGPG